MSIFSDADGVQPSVPLPSQLISGELVRDYAPICPRCRPEQHRIGTNPILVLRHVYRPHAIFPVQLCTGYVARVFHFAFLVSPFLTYWRARSASLLCMCMPTLPRRLPLFENSYLHLCLHQQRLLPALFNC